jgi:hypothetical protein
MSQVPILLGIHLVGLALVAALGPRKRPALASALAFPAGLAFVCVLSLLWLVVGIPYRFELLASAVCLSTLAFAVLAARRGVERRALKLGAVWTVAFALACYGLTRVNVAVLTYDSHYYVLLGGVVAREGMLTPFLDTALQEWGVFQVLAHSLGAFSRHQFLYALPLVLGLSFIPVFGLTLWHGLGRSDLSKHRRLVAAVAVTATLCTVNAVAYHTLYIHTNMAVAVYLFIATALLWIADADSDPTLVPVAFIALTALALQRTETPIVAALFLVLRLADTRLPRRLITAWVACFVAVVSIWYEAIARFASPESAFLTPTRSRLVWAGLVLCLLWCIAGEMRIIRRLNRFIPALVAAAVLLALAIAFATKTDHMLTSLSSWYQNLSSLEQWGQTWYLLAAMTVVALVVKAPPFPHAFSIGIPAYLGGILLLSAISIPYRVGVGDSANRMAVHVVPIIFFYLAIKVCSCETRTHQA